MIDVAAECGGLTEQVELTGRVFAMPNEYNMFAASDCEAIYAPILEGIDATLLVIEQPEGWHAGYTATLPDGSIEVLPHAFSLPATRLDATIAVCEKLIAWCGGQKDLGSKKHRKQSERLQDWALAVEKREREAAATSPRLMSVDEVRAAEDRQWETVARLPIAAPLHPRANLGTVQLIPIDLLHESGWNPRQHYPEAAMAELVESMRTSGYREWLPLMVRPASDGNGYEIGAGHRRTRAAREAGITQIPCVVRELSDEQFLDVLNFDNSGREDVHPMHEAAGWKVWMERTGGGVLDIAARIGQSKEYVYQRLKYAALIEPARAAFMDGKITARHAILIARLEPKQQEQALEYCEPPNWDLEQKVSARTLETWIKRNLHCTLEDTPWDLDDATLIPAAGACTVCPHRRGNQPDFNPSEDLPNVCTNSDCADEKHAAWRERIREKNRAAQPAPEPWKDRPLPPVDATSKPAKLSKAQKDALKANREESERIAAEERERIRLEEEREAAERQAKMDAEKASRLRILRAILAKVKWPPRREEVECLLSDIELPDEMDDVLREQGLMRGDECIFVDPAKLGEQKLAMLLMCVQVSNDFDTWSYGHGAEKLHAAAKRYGVDPHQVRAEAEGGTRKAVIGKLPTLAKPAAKKAAVKKPAPKPVKKPAPKPAAKKAAKKGGKK